MVLSSAQDWIIERLVQALAYRFQIQEQFLVVAENLIELELLSIDDLYAPMDLRREMESVNTVLEALQCFHLFKNAWTIMITS
jgi:hypothetical protein